MKQVIITIFVIGIFMAACIGSAQASIISWVDWQSAGTGIVSGTLSVAGSTIDVTYGGSYLWAQTSGGTNYWSPSAPYLSTAVVNAPPASDIIALNAGGSKMITFSEKVKDPILALVSWNSNTVDFGVPIEILSYGAGFWGNGTPILNAAGTGFSGSGEVHGVIRLPGEYNSIAFSDNSENWHGLTVGVTGLPSSVVPEPGTMFLLGTGLLSLFGSRIRRNKK